MTRRDEVILQINQKLFEENREGQLATQNEDAFVSRKLPTVEKMYRSAYCAGRSEGVHCKTIAMQRAYDQGYDDGVNSIQFTEEDAIDRLCYSEWLKKEKDEAYNRGIKDGARLAILHGTDAISQEQVKSFNDSIKVGDEVTVEGFGGTAVVTYLNDDYSDQHAALLFNLGGIEYRPVEKCYKTGRQFPQVKALLKEMSSK